MRSIRSIRSEGPQGPVYLMFSDSPVVSTEPIEQDDEVVVDYDGAGEVVGVELVSVSTATLQGLIEVAGLHRLDLSSLFARSVGSQAA